MAVTWTAEQVLALAPDDASAKAGRGLASTRHWVSLGATERAAWGECRGSAKDPYQTEIDLLEPAFHCTCPSRKFPCKHSLGLFMLYTEQRAAFKQQPPPAWVNEWLAKRDEAAIRREKSAARQEETPPASSARKRASTQTQRAAQRQDRVAAGMQELGRWLRDLVRQGLAFAQAQPPQYWENVAARMVDAQAPGVARRLREMSSIPASGEGWAERLLERIGLLHLLVESYQRIDSLPEATRADIRAALGFTLKQEELLTMNGVRDTWMVLGQRSYEEDRLRVQRTWLQGQQTGRMGLLLEFAYGDQLLDTTILPGTQFEAELVFYPGSYPLRAVLKEGCSDLSALTNMPSHPNHSTALAAYADALAHNPWIETFPLAIQALIPLREGEHWHIRDDTMHALPLAASFTGGWHLVALSGGCPIAVFGEWDGHALYPLSVWADGRYARL